jgi:CyaY protein
VDETTFFKRCDAVFTVVEDSLDATDLDTDIARQDRVLEITFENRSKLILSANEPVKELWLAARSGGFHYRWIEAGPGAQAADRHTSGWVDTRSGETLTQALERCVQEQTGESVRFALPE